MTVVEILCLANSRKRGGRCLAGLKMDGSGWIRPIGTGSEGALLPQQSQVGRQEAQVLDRLRIDLARPVPKPHQPENWLLERKWYNPWHKPCRLAARLDASEIHSFLEAHLVAVPELLGCRGDRVDVSAFQKTPAKASLTLVRPANLRWLIRTSSAGKRQTRALFDLAGSPYNLSVTDLLWEQKLGSLPLGVHPFQRGDTETGHDVLLTVSLGEPFDGCCYKLIAAVIVMPESSSEETDKQEIAS